MKTKYVSALCLVVVSLALGGCVWPGDIDSGLVGRYQQAMSARTAQPRVGAKGLDSLRPAKGKTGPPLAEERIVVEEVKSTTSYEKALPLAGGRPRDRVKTVVVTTHFNVDDQTGERDPKTGKAVRRVETDITRTFALDPNDRDLSDKPRPVLSGLERREAVFVRDPATGQLQRHVETTATSTLTKAVNGDFVRVEMKTTTRTTTFTVDPATGRRDKANAQPEETTTRRISLVEFEELSKPPRQGETKRYRRIGAAHGERSMVVAARRLVRLSLNDAIVRALANNLDIRVVSYDPAVAREQMIQAAAVFDYVVFGGTTYSKDERRRAATFITGDISRVRDWRLGIGQTRTANGQDEHKTVTGATWSLEWAMNRTWDNSRFTDLQTRYEPTVTIQVTQPLLRNAWPEFNLAQLRIARINTKISDEEFRSKVEETITQVIAAYWTLIQARRDLVIQEKLLDQTEKTHERTVGRGMIDASMATIKQAEASVKIREAVLIRARKNILDVQDTLARLLADAQVNVLSQRELVPTTPLITEHVRVDATEELLTALGHNPLLEQARLAIAAARINVGVAKNQLLPTLDLSASTGIQGLARKADRAHHKMLRGDYNSYSIGLLLDYPIGNRRNESLLRQRKYERTKAIVSMQNTADQIAVAVYERVRQVRTTYDEMLAQRAAVEAARVQLQALDDTERIRAQLTPEFLRVKLQAQETLANAERAELQAMVDYNNAMADLARITGTTLDLHGIKIAMPAVTDGTWFRPAEAEVVPASRPATQPGGKP